MANIWLLGSPSIKFDTERLEQGREFSARETGVVGACAPDCPLVNVRRTPEFNIQAGRGIETAI